jgi:hypothetical protein
MKMRTIAVCVPLVLMGFWSANADVTKLPTERRNALENISHFREAYAVTNLPPPVLALCADINGRLAGPGQKWEVTDLITNEELPLRRLIWAATDGDYWVVHYERGGIAHSYHVMVVQLPHGDSKPSFLWRGAGGRLKDFPAFLAAVRSNKLDDTLEYAH